MFHLPREGLLRQDVDALLCVCLGERTSAVLLLHLRQGVARCVELGILLLAYTGAHSGASEKYVL